MMNNRLPFVLLTILILGIAACKIVGNGPEDIPADQPLPIENLVQIKHISDGNLLGDGAEGIDGNTSLMIQTEEEWEELRAKMNSVNPNQKEISIDFNERTILAYFDKVRPSGGFSVEIAYATEELEKINAVIKFRSPSGNAIEIMSQPFHIVSIPKTKKSINYTFIALTE